VVTFSLFSVESGLERPQSGAGDMSKEHRNSREAKKPPSLSPKERKALKKAKSAAKKSLAI